MKPVIVLGGGCLKSMCVSRKLPSPPWLEAAAVVCLSQCRPFWPVTVLMIPVYFVGHQESLSTPWR